MTIWHIAWNYLWNRKLTTILTIASVALGVGLITAVLILREETERRFVEEGQAFDIAIGAEGSTQQLVLSTVYFIGQPAGNIPYQEYEHIKEDPDVLAAFPIGLGDSFRGFRLVGTTADLFAHDWTNRITGEPRNTYQLEDGGRYFDKPFEAVIGSEVAKTTQMKVGDTFVSTHGLTDMIGVEAHDDLPYTVVGIMQPSGTPNDRVAFCSLDSIWDQHEHEYGSSSLTGGASVGELARQVTREADAAEESHNGELEHHDDRDVTSVLVILESPGMRFEFVRRISDDLPNIVAAIPVREIQNLYNQFLGPVRQVLLAIGYLVVVISSISILIGLYLSIIQRKRDLAIMRALGAAAGEIMGAVLIEAFWVTLLGIASGWVVGTGLTYVLSGYLTERFGFAISVFRPSPDMVSAYSAVLLMGMIAGIVPAIQAYRTDVARDLVEP